MQKIRKSALLLCTCLAFFASQMIAGAQTKVSGTVVDNAGEPVIGASVVEKGTMNGTMTDIDGAYSLTVQPNATLVVSCIGYATQEVAVGNRGVVNFTLAEDNEFLDEVVVVGYGVQKKKLVTGSTIQVKGEELAKLNTTSALTAMQSQSPGVSIMATSGQPGEGFNVNIRGMGTIGSYEPLYVIDGVTGGDINALNPADIESIDVLKDAASCAIYGARGANGVILVTTKQGKAGKSIVTYDGFYGWQNSPTMPELLNARQYMAIEDQVNVNDGKAPHNWAGALNPSLYNSIMNGSFTGTNWLDEIRNVNAPIQNHALNVVGGNDISNYSLGVSYTGQEGIFGKPVASNYKRTTVRLNSEHVIWRQNGRDIITVGENMTYTYSTKSGIGTGNQYWNDISWMLRANPMVPVRDDEGNYTEYDWLKNSGLWNIQNGFGNPIAAMTYSSRGNNMSQNHALRLSGNVKVMPIKNLVFKSQINYSMSAGSYRQYSMIYKINTTTNDFSDVDNVSQSGWAGWSWSWENTANYKFFLGDNHNFDVLVGSTLEHSGYGENMGGSMSNGAWPNDWTHAYVDSMTDASTATASGSTWGDSGLASFFGRINYDFAEKYMFTAILRADGSSNFARGHRWGIFPSFSAGWVMTNEPWLESARGTLDFLKLRASWGQNGNCNVSGFQYLATVAVAQETAGYAFGQGSGARSFYDPGAFADRLANEDISWETSQQLDLGLDARFFKNRLALTYDWYRKDTRDWLVNAPIMGHFGADAPYINGGDVRNQGMELAINWTDQIGKDFSYNIGVNAAFNKNQITRLANDEGIIHGVGSVVQGIAELYRAQVGYPIGYFWTYKSDGVFQNQAEIDQWIASGKPTMSSTPQPGDLKFVDLDGNGVLDDNDKTMTGDPNPHHTLGVNIGFNFKGFDLSATGYGAFGHQIFRALRRYGDSQYDNYTTEVYNYWHGEGTSNLYPRLVPGTNYNFMQNSNIFIEDADYFRIQNITLGYDLKKLWKTAPFEKFRIYAQAQNFFTFTKYMGMDPEVGTSTTADSWAKGIDLGFYPQAKTILVGVNLSFAPPVEGQVFASTYVPKVPERVVEKVVEVVKEVPVEKQVVKEVVKEVKVYPNSAMSEDVYFVINRSDLTVDEAIKVGEIAKTLKDNPDAKVVISGHADTGTGSADRNNELVKLRADVVSKALQKAGIAASRIFTEFKGVDRDASLSPEANRVAVCIVK